jgi:hypothetical protein
MLITAHIDKWDVTRVLVDNGSLAEILFLSAFDKMGFNRRIEQIDSISLSVSFGSLRNARTEHITFDIVGMHYPYNAIFDRGLLNPFEVALHSIFLCLKVPAALGVISIHGYQKNARNIEQAFALGHRNVNYL